MKVVINLGVPSLLTIVFVVLKLCGVIAWSWWWVLSPLWILAAFYVLLFIILFTLEYLGDKNL